MRKPAFHIGWDVTPRLITYGIVKPVFIRAFSKAKIEGLLLRNSEITKFEMDEVELFGRVEVSNIE